MTHLLTMSGHPILVRVDRDGMHRELMGSPEHSDRDFLRYERVRYWHRSSYKSLYARDLAHRASNLRGETERTPRFAARILVSGPPWPAALRRRVWIECTGVPGALGVLAKMEARRGGCKPAVSVDTILSLACSTSCVVASLGDHLFF